MWPEQLLAKLSSGMNKPSAQTLVLPEKMRDLLAPLPLSRIKGLGGDLGAKVQVSRGQYTRSNAFHLCSPLSRALGIRWHAGLQADLNVTTVSDLWAVPMTRLEQLYGPSTGRRNIFTHTVACGAGRKSVLATKH